jgi:small subunit ribosomal protein S16
LTSGTKFAIILNHLKKDNDFTMLSIRLMRFGAKKKPFYRIVVMETRSPRQSKAKDVIGTYDPSPDPAEIHLDLEKAKSWLAKGARASQTVQSLIKRASTSKSIPNHS